MALFDKWRKKPDTPKQQQSAPQPEPLPDQQHSPAYLELLARSVGVARLRQQRLGEFLGGRDWNVDFSRGVVTFAELEFPMGFLGSESHSQNNWMWGSHNVNGFGGDVIADVTNFVQGPLMADMPDLAGDTVPLDDYFNGHNISSVIAAQCGRTCYYRCPYDGGAAFVLVKGLPDELFAPVPAESIITTLMELVNTGLYAHRPLAAGMLNANCSSVEAAPDKMVGTYANGSKLELNFDELGRMRNFKSHIGA